MREDIETRLRNAAAADPEFRGRLVADPKATACAFLGVAVPDGIDVRVIEEAPGEVVLVLPPEGRRTLTPADLDRVSAGLPSAPPVSQPGLPRGGSIYD